MSSPKFFQPIRVGDLELAHRVVFAPTTRFRADTDHVPLPHVAEYYEQRASMPGSLLVSEAVFIAHKAGGYTNAPGIWSEEQILAWKKITDAVHAKGSYIFMELWAMGRPANPDTEVPHALTVDEIQEYVQLYTTAASNAVHKAGFDGVDLGAPNGYLLDQFLHDGSNVRTDRYGGSVENRARFPLEVTEAVVKAIGQKRTGFRISPWGTFNDMHFTDPAGPKPTFTYLVTQLRDRYPDLAYLHVVEPRADGIETVEHVKDGYSNDFIREIWGDRPLISAGGYTRETALAVAEEKGDLIAFSRSYVSNPDLPYRILHDLPLTVGDRSLYYRPGSLDPKGYTDYPFAVPVEA
ncbi:NADH:flavin oxidoreductase/NADH oxidase [Roridomyces roridus]|uniref:NADH:flavin oxidoreductase/NADH oxidase n=1 Tax=Roridomyces roridus TaxID=1738132 RepID=A0AAD7F8E7_9AGAR|nr:NADH:flavin oxidoreductase/NADH oxidase [Roridomyces roridus]